MKSAVRNFICMLALVAGLTTPALPGHIAGASLSYDHLGGNQYEVFLRVYRDCQGLPLTPTVPICYSSADSNYYSSELAAVMSTTALPPFPYLPQMTTTCNGGNGYGIECIIYATVILLPFEASDWEFSWTAPSVVQTPIQSNFLVTTRLDNVVTPDNSGPEFTFDPVFLYCSGQPAWDNLVATDPDGDSLVYSLIPLIIGNDSNCPALATYPIPQNPFPISAVPHTIHLQDGYVYFEPTFVGQYFMHIQVEEFRNGTMINATTLWHMATVVNGCVVTGEDELTGAGMLSGPNPVKDELKFNIHQSNIGFAITDIMGREVMKTVSKNSSGEHILNVENLAPGIYYARYFINSKPYNIKFVKS